MTNKVYVNRDNAIYLVLEYKELGGTWIPLDMSSVTKIIIDMGNIIIDSGIVPTAVNWSEQSIPFYEDDVYVLTIKLGDQNIPVGRYTAHVIIFDPNHPNGLVWEKLKIQVYDLE